MRKIKFRQIIGNGKYHYWGYLDGTPGRFITPLSSTDDKGGIPESSEYTGLEDKNGKEIYEGDIIFKDYENGKAMHGIRNEPGNYKGIVGYGRSAFGAVDIKDKDEEDWDYLDDFNGIEVIGNIYENPELLK